MRSNQSPNRFGKMEDDDGDLKKIEKNLQNDSSGEKFLLQLQEKMMKEMEAIKGTIASDHVKFPCVYTTRL